MKPGDIVVCINIVIYGYPLTIGKQYEVISERGYTLGNNGIILGITIINDRDRKWTYSSDMFTPLYLYREEQLKLLEI